MLRRKIPCKTAYHPLKHSDKCLPHAILTGVGPHPAAQRLLSLASVVFCGCRFCGCKIYLHRTLHRTLHRIFLDWNLWNFNEPKGVWIKLSKVDRCFCSVFPFTNRVMKALPCYTNLHAAEEPWRTQSRKTTTPYYAPWVRVYAATTLQSSNSGPAKNETTPSFLKEKATTNQTAIRQREKNHLQPLSCGLLVTWVCELQVTSQEPPSSRLAQLAGISSDRPAAYGHQVTKRMRRVWTY